MKKIIGTFLFILPALLFGQTKDSIRVRTSDCAVHTYRAMLLGISDLDDGGTLLAVSYEYKLKGPFSLRATFGPALFRNFAGTINDRPAYRYSLNLNLSAEARYYLTLNHRIKKQKPTLNLSALYLGLEQRFLTNGLVLFKDKNGRVVNDRSNLFLNVGWQRQVKRTYLTAYVGLSMTSDYTTTSSVLDVLHSGIGIGRVL